MCAYEARSKLGIEHPDYLYPASKNPYAKRFADFETFALTDNATERLRGRWLQAGFPGRVQTGPLHVEVGCNAGHVLVEWAKRDPAAAYVGVDWKMKAIARGAEKLKKHELPNARLVRAHAARLPYIFGEGEIDFLYLYFPDPWPKKGDWKHRFVTQATLRRVHPLLKKGGVMHIKTDHDAYFEWMLEHITATSDLWEVRELTRDLHAGHPDPTLLKIPDVTLFEGLFVKDGIKVKSVKLVAR